MATSAPGPSSECFFVGRADLLSWVNGLLGTHLTKVEAVRVYRTRQTRRRRAAQTQRWGPICCPHAQVAARLTALCPVSPPAQLASGAAHCQIIDAIHPGVVALHKARPRRRWMPTHVV